MLFKGMGEVDGRDVACLINENATRILGIRRPHSLQTSRDEVIEGPIQVQITIEVVWAVRIVIEFPLKLF